MHRPLNIPLAGEQTTRRDYRRVVSLTAVIILGVFLAVIVFRLQFVAAKTLRYQPENVAVSIHVLATASNVRILQEKMGNTTFALGSPWTLQQVLTHTKREVSVHIATDGTVTLVIDTELAADDIAALASFGYTATPNNGVTVMAPAGTTVRDTGRKWSLKAILPTFDGDIIVHKTTPRRSTLHISEASMTLAGVGLAVNAMNGPSVGEGSIVLANLAIPDGLLALPAVAESLLPIPATSRAIAALLQYGGSLRITEDEAGRGYFLSFPPGDLTVEELASLGKDIMNRQTLTTQAWTTDDGEEFDEIRSSTEEITTEIRAEEDFTFITLANNAGDTLRLARTPSLLTIANREISLENSEKTRSICLYRAHTWFTPSILNEQGTETMLNTNRHIVTMLENFSEIAISPHKIRFCW